MINDTNMKGCDGMEILKLTDEAFEQYRLDTKNNERISRDQAEKKITRNVLLAMKVPPKKDYHRERGTQLYVYGCMWIVVKDDTVVHISNGKFNKKYPGWKMDVDKYNELTKELGIAN